MLRSRTLTVLALMGAAVPSTYALSIKDESAGLSVGVKLQTQLRANLFADGSNATGANYDPLRGANGEAEPARFEVRRARFALGWKYGDHWEGNFSIRGGEGYDRGNLPTATSPAVNRGVELYYANAAWYTKASGLEHKFTFGLDKAFNAESSISSTAFLFPNERVTSQLLETRNVGVGYRLTGDFFRVGADLMNNSTGTKDANAGDDTGNEQKNGMFYSARAEIGLGSEWWSPKRMESWCGKEGQALIIGVDFMQDKANLSDNATAATWASKDTSTWGPDVTFHYNEISALFELKMRTTKQENKINAGAAAANPADIKGQWWVAQVAYAFPSTAESIGAVVEPAFRYSKFDSNKDLTQQTVYTGEMAPANSGKAIDLGVNLYFNGHNNKLQFGFQKWTAEDGSGDARIFRIQHCLFF